MVYLASRRQAFTCGAEPHWNPMEAVQSLEDCHSVWEEAAVWEKAVLVVTVCVLRVVWVQEVSHPRTFLFFWGYSHHCLARDSQESYPYIRSPENSDLCQVPRFVLIRYHLRCLCCQGLYLVHMSQDHLGDLEDKKEDAQSQLDFGYASMVLDSCFDFLDLFRFGRGPQTWNRMDAQGSVIYLY